MWVTGVQTCALPIFTNFIAEQVDAAAMATSADYDKLDPQTIYEAIVAAQAEG